ncbi:transcription antitermination protein [Haloarcula litorea]|uniref:transcription antitermination protein n=1 Tax=Haloarcula litorea TaxID=3032579 RepID=UPI0023E894D8|nr:transcription antitermination protein [Halomicroarcula sp. GDY20]
MDPADVLDAVRDGAATELDRLGSDKLLVAATGASMTTETVAGVALARERGVAATLDDWAGTVDGPAADALRRAGAAAGERADRIAAAVADADPGDGDALTAHLAGVEGTAARVGAGLIAVPLVADRFYLQLVSYFVNEADEGRADLFRELRTSASDLDPAGDALGVLDEGGRERARDAALDAVDAAYEDYAETLRGMGLDPKPIC